MWERTLAARYLRARREDGGVALISLISFIGIFLAVAVLIIVMSVMNGFRAELLGRILGVNGHVFVDVRNMPIPEARAIVAKAKALPGVVDVMPKIDGQVMAVGQGGNLARGAMVTGLAASDLAKLKIVSGNLVGGNLKTWGTGEYGGDEIAMGSRLAEALGVLPGDSVQLISPQGASTPFGTTPRIKDYTVSAIFDIGMSEYDATFIYMPIEQAQLFFSKETSWDTIELRMQDPDKADLLALEVAKFSQNRYVTDWRQQSESLVSALQIERNVMRLILMLIVAIAAMNIISGLVMLVKNKGRDIAILRTMGASRASIMGVFMMSGASVGILATLAGAIGGALFCLNSGTIQKVVEFVFGPVFNADIYFLSQIPAKVEWHEVITTALFAAIASVVATLPPSWRASKLDPVEALRYE
ncbi:lipoprotein-releasing ABC transporter permease subunit [Aquidulcibacter sp.]|uniref:lipoprotein-releasing ABC transporter permease subunit n=1 Tax=Aquidulcibacter sp. TaxID=2052990 RepID=UPI0025BEFA08|nr:lipoprotein-releasing ABC transporter permease subunit [Aquidulcibacter sp.]